MHMRPSHTPVKTNWSYLICQLDKMQVQPTHSCARHRPCWSVRKSYSTSTTCWLISGLWATRIERQRPWHTSFCAEKPRHLGTICGIRMQQQVDVRPCIQDGKAAMPPGRVYARHGFFLLFSFSLSLLRHDSLPMVTPPCRQGLCRTVMLLIRLPVLMYTTALLLLTLKYILTSQSSWSCYQSVHLLS
jgi:hypothetical protein